MELATNNTAVTGESGSPSGATGDGAAGLMVFLFDHWYGVFIAPSPGRVFTVIRYQKVPSISLSLCVGIVVRPIFPIKHQQFICIIKESPCDIITSALFREKSLHSRQSACKIRILKPEAKAKAKSQKW